MTTVTVKGKRGSTKIFRGWPEVVELLRDAGAFRMPKKVNGFSCDANRVRVGKTRSERRNAA